MKFNPRNMLNILHMVNDIQTYAKGHSCHVIRFFFLMGGKAMISGQSNTL